MATKALVLSTYSKVTFTYSVTSTETTTTVTITSVKFTNSRSGGTNVKLWLSVYAYPPSGTAYGYFNGSAIPKGTKSKTWSVSWSKTFDKGHSTSSTSVELGATMWNADADTWDEDGSFSVSVPARASYPVTYDANGGTGAPGSQTKWHGESLTLQAGSPTREHHTFLGWSTDPAATAAQYQSSSSYTGNAALRLYAVWQRVYAPPVLEISALYRCDSSGDPSDEGRYAAVEAAYALYSSSYTKTWSVSLAPSDGTGTALTATTPRSDSNGVAKFVMGGSLDTDTQYTAEVTLADSQGGAAEATTVSAMLPVAYYPIDVLDGGHGIAIGGVAKREYFDEYLPAAFHDDVLFAAFAGVIQMFAGTTPPAGWLICDGSAVSRTTYAALFAVIGTTYGTGNGSTTFNLPDFRGRVAVGAGTGANLTARTLGATGGHESMQSHSHGTGTFRVLSWSNGTASGIVSRSNATIDRKSSSSGSNYGATTHTITTNTQGSGDSGNMQPFAVVNYIICTGKTS